MAIPDNLLNNYVTFSELAGLKVETFDYIGNGTVQLLCDSFLENAVVVQLEEQATVISILEIKTGLSACDTVRLWRYDYGGD